MLNNLAAMSGLPSAGQPAVAGASGKKNIPRRCCKALIGHANRARCQRASARNVDKRTKKPRQGVPTSRRFSPKGWLPKNVAHGVIQRKRCSAPQKSVGCRRKTAPKPERPRPTRSAWGGVVRILTLFWSRGTALQRRRATHFSQRMAPKIRRTWSRALLSTA